MATSDGDVIMTDDAPTATTTAPEASSSSTNPSTSQHTRTDHDRKYYCLPEAPLERPKVHISEDVISRFGLEEAHEKVRRFDPKTGEKLTANKLRKSYVGIVKGLHLAGSNKEVSTPGQWVTADPIAEPNGLFEKSEEQWDQEVPRPVTKDAAAGLLAKLDRAMQMAPGKLDDGDKWKKMLGEDVPKKAAPPPVAKAMMGARPSPKLSAQQQGRSQRMGAKRTYDEASFAGYEETYDDVELSRKKPRKVSAKSPKELEPPAATKRRGRKKR